MTEIKIGDITIKQTTDGLSNKVLTYFQVKDSEGFLRSSFYEDKLSGEDLSFQLALVGKALMEMASHAIGKSKE